MNELKIINLLVKNKYIIEHIRQKRFITFYVQTIIRHCKNAKLSTIN